MKLTLSLLFTIAIMSVEGFGPCSSSSPTHEHGSWYGQSAFCEPDYSVLSVCGSGTDANCKTQTGNKAFNIIGCSCSQRWAPDFNETLAKWYYGTFGEQVSCPGNQVVVAICGSGKTSDCKDDQGNKHCHGVKCAPIRYNAAYVLPGNWLNGASYGATISCGKEQAVCGLCMSGRHGDCNKLWTNVKCCNVAPKSGQE
eukprot:m.67360 g.67360  ORF g.67360 m.67360 type:complete len:198 (-) comp11883_c1_seq1:70-663(-)